MKVWARISLIQALIVLLLPVVGAFGTKAGLWHFGLGFQTLQWTFGLGIASAISGGIGMVIWFFTAQDKSNLFLHGKAVFLCVVMAVFLFSLYRSAMSHPPIHDISTDVDDPPEFFVKSAERGNSSNPLEYTETKRERQLEGYTDLMPLEIEATLTPAVALVDQAVRDLDFEGIHTTVGCRAYADELRCSGTIEATDTTFWYGFKDDVAVRVANTYLAGSTIDGGLSYAPGSRSLIDVRSVSRVGIGDLGKNASRIDAVLKVIEEMSADDLQELDDEITTFDPNQIIEACARGITQFTIPPSEIEISCRNYVPPSVDSGGDEDVG